MLSPKYAAPLSLSLLVPQQVIYFLLAVVVATGLVAFSLPWSWWWCGVATASIWVVGLWSVQRRFAALAQYGFVELVWDTNDEWWLYDQFGDAFAARLLPGYFAQPFLVILTFRVETDGRRVSVMLAPTVDNADLLRQLRVRLKTTTLTEGAPS